MFLKYFLIALSNIFIFSIGILWNTRMSLLAFILIAYLLPIILNNIINLSIEGTRNVKIYVITSGITTFCYFIFSIYFISRPGFDYFISENQIDTGNVSIEINTGLANIEQLIFVFLLNFIALFLISLFIRKKDLNVRNKKFKKSDRYSLKDVSFKVEQGEIVGLIGKNGAGKTTLMKLIAKAIKPTSGDVLINEKSILTTSNGLKDFGFMIESALFNHLNALDHLKYFISLNGKETHYQNIEEVLKLVDLWEKRKVNPNNFSFGMKQRLSLAVCLVTEPKILILDEPFVGLDPNGVEKLISTLQQWVQKQDTAIIISSHQLSELEAICNRYLFIDNGELKEDFNSEKNDGTIIELNKDFVLTSVFKEKYKDYIAITSTNNVIEVTTKRDILNELLSDLIQEYKILSIKDKKDYIHQKFKGENR